MNRRSGVSKSRSASQFRHNIQRTKSANIPRTPMRGGWRL